MRNANRTGLLLAALGALSAVAGPGDAKGAEPVWTYAEASPAPPPSNAGGWTVWDSRRESFVHHPGQFLYGGHRPGHTYPTRTYRWQPDSREPWTVLTTATDLPPLEMSAAAYDSDTDAIWVFGGKHTTYSWDTFSSATTVNTNIWKLALDSSAGWQVVTVAGTPPPPRFDASMVLDVARRRLLVFGGIDTLAARFDDVWSLNLDGTPTWQELHPAGALGARCGHAAVFDRPRDRMIVACGEGAGGTLLSDVWTLEFGDSLRWQPLDLTGATPVGSAAGAIDESRDRWIVVTHGEPIRVHALSLSDPPAWQTVSPARRAPDWATSFVIPRISVAWDPTRDALAVLWPMGAFNGELRDAPLLRFGPLPIVNVTAEFRHRIYENGTSYTYWSVHSDRPLYDRIGIVMTESDPPWPSPVSLWEFPDANGSIVFRQDGASRVGRYAYCVHWFDGLAERDTGDFPMASGPIAIAGLSNPARGALAFSIQLSDRIPARVDVHDVSGRLRFSRTLQGNGTHPVDVAARGWSAGIYFVSVSHADHRTVRTVAFMP